MAEWLTATEAAWKEVERLGCRATENTERGHGA
jgi:hypothetical protein